MQGQGAQAVPSTADEAWSVLAAATVRGISPVTAVIRWIIDDQRGRVAAMMLSYCAFFGAQQLAPYFVGQALQDELGGGHHLVWWICGLAGAVVVVAGSGYGSWILLQYVRWDAVILVQRAVQRQVTRLGRSANLHFTTGEIISVTTADAQAFGALLAFLGLEAGSVFSFAATIVLLALSSPLLALVTLIGMPLMLLSLQRAFRVLETRQSARRTAIGQASTLLADTINGLRVLRGLGGEKYFADRYHAASEDVRTRGEQVARSFALLEGAQVALPGLLLLVVVWLGARLAASGQVSTGGFIAFYGYLILLSRPMTYTIQTINAYAGARVGARRVYAFLTVRPPHHPVPASGYRPWPTGPVELTDTRYGVLVRSGRLTVLVASAPEHSTEILQRLALTSDDADADASVRLGGAPLADFDPEQVRTRIHLLPHASHLFSGDLHEQLDVDGQRAPGDLIAALHVAYALDMVGLDPAESDLDPPPRRAYHTHLQLRERGRGLSGGQVQRLVLARALATDAQVLLLDRPTSAVDAHTEARIAARLVRRRAGRTTLVATESSEFLRHADDVVFCHAGTVQVGTHTELLADPAYRELVQR